MTPVWCVLLQSSQNLAQISDLQAQLEEAMKEKQDVQEKVSSLWHPDKSGIITKSTMLLAFLENIKDIFLFKVRKGQIILRFRSPLYSKVTVSRQSFRL